MKLTRESLIRIIKEEMDSMPGPRGIYASEQSFSSAPQADLPRQDLDAIAGQAIQLMKDGEGFGRALQMAVYNKTGREDQPTENAVANHIAEIYDGSIMNFFMAMRNN